MRLFFLVFCFRLPGEVVWYKNTVIDAIRLCVQRAAETESFTVCTFWRGDSKGRGQLCKNWTQVATEFCLCQQMENFHTYTKPNPANVTHKRTHHQQHIFN